MRAGTPRSYIYTSDQLADGVVTTAKIADSTITQPKFVTAIREGKIRAYLSGANQAIPAATWTKVQLNTESFDQCNLFDSAVNYRMTMNASYVGYWLIYAQVVFANQAAANQVQIQITLGGISACGSGIAHQIGGQGSITVNSFDYRYMAAGQYIEIFVYTVAAGTVVLGAANSFATFIRIF